MVMQWFKSGKSVRGVALVIHGLNLDPSKMMEIIDVLNGIQLDALLLSLRGHGDNFDHHSGQREDKARLAAFKRVSGKTWQEEVREGYEACINRAEILECPAYFVGYSLGGLLGCNLMLSDDLTRFDRMFLFAPAITTHRIRVPFMRLLYLFPRIVIPSLSPEHYRSSKGTPIAAYLSLLEIIRSFKAHLNSSLNIPSVVVIDKEDELVSYGKLKKLIHKNRLSNWRIHKIKRSPQQLKYPFHHLIIDEQSVGARQWKSIRESIIDHFKAS